MRHEATPAIPSPTLVGVVLSGKSQSDCKHCMPACSLHWDADWLSPEDAEVIPSQLAATAKFKALVPCQFYQ